MTGGWETVPPGIRLRVSRKPLSLPGPALFLDRDGIVVRDPGYLHRAEDVCLMAGAAALIHAANHAGIPVLVATNQSGVARGLYGWDAFDAVQAEISAQLAVSDAWLDGVAACPFHPDFTPDYGPEQDRYRKPGPGLIELLARRLNVDRSVSWLVGDRRRDIEAARAAGLAGGVLVCRDDGGRSVDLPGDNAAFSVLRCPAVADVRRLLAERIFH